MQHLSPDLAPVKKPIEWGHAPHSHPGATPTHSPEPHGPIPLGPGGGSTAYLSQAFSGLLGDGHTESLDAKPGGGDPAPVAKPKPGVFPGVHDLTGTSGGLAAGKRSRT